MIFVNRQTVGSYDFIAEDERYNRVAGVDYQLPPKTTAGRVEHGFTNRLKKMEAATIKAGDFVLIEIQETMKLLNRPVVLVKITMPI